MESHSIFKKYYEHQVFVDTLAAYPDHGVDVLIPVMHTNELWRSNLFSIYREIPVRRLLIGDGGCIDNTLQVLKDFPRVTVYNHREYKSLGFSIRKLIEEVQTPWFVYLHSDVFLPQDWYAKMKAYCSKYDWFECRQRLTVLVDYPLAYGENHRPLSGSQMGRREAFTKILPKIDDDYLYRNEDLIFAELIQEHGFQYGRVDETFHYHQMMNKDSKWHRKIRGVYFDVEKSEAEELREFTMQIKGLIKYTVPKPLYVESVTAALGALQKSPNFNWDELNHWVKENYPAWLPYIKKHTARERVKHILTRLYRVIFH